MRLDGTTETTLARSLSALLPDERGWITFAEARILFSSNAAQYAFGETDKVVCGLVRTKPVTQLLLRLGYIKKGKSRVGHPVRLIHGHLSLAVGHAAGRVRGSALRVQRRSPSPAAHRACAIGSHATLLSARRGSSNAALRLACSDSGI
jgi:hypothetical protein